MKKNLRPQQAAPVVRPKIACNNSSGSNQHFGIQGSHDPGYGEYNFRHPFAGDDAE